MKRIFVFIDASNIWEAQKKKGRFIDYVKLNSFFNKIQNDFKIYKKFYYTAYPKQSTRDYDLTSKHKFYAFLQKGAGFTVVKKELKVKADIYFDLIKIDDIWGNQINNKTP